MPTARPTGVFFSISRVECATLELTADAAERSEADDLDLPLTYTLTGPPHAVSCLEKALGKEASSFTGLLSPVSSVSVVGSAAVSVGIPRDAKSFAFSYPFALTEQQQQQLFEQVSHLKLPQPPVWLDFMLRGGFCYFDASMRVAGCNALGFEQRGTASLTLVGPYAVRDAVAGEALRMAGRLRDTTIDSLRASGFRTFGWVFKGEQPGGGSLGAQHDQGAFVYGHVDGGFYFYQLYLPEQVSRVSAFSTLSGPMLQLNNAMAASVTNAMAQLQVIKERVERLREEDARLMRDAQALSMASVEEHGGAWARYRETRLRLLSLASMGIVVLIAAGLLFLAPDAQSSAASAASGVPLDRVLLGPSTFRLLASFTWFGVWTVVTWRILSDCSTEGLTREQRVCAARGLVLVPSLATLSEAAALALGALDAAAVVPRVVATVLVFAVLPSLIYGARRRSALSFIAKHEARQMDVVDRLARAKQERPYVLGLTRESAAAGAPSSESQALPASAMEARRLQAAVGLQSAFRRRRLRQQARDALIRRRRQLIGLSYPILLALVFCLVGDLLVEHATALPAWLRGWSCLILLLPTGLVLMHDQRGDETRRLQRGLAFSMTHAVFFAGFLHHLLFQFPRWVLWLFASVESLLPSDPATVSALTSLVYFSTTIVIHQLGQKALALATFTNFFPHLLFPLHFFDFALYYSLVAAPLYISWSARFVVSALLLQLNIVLKNSGTYEGLLSKLRREVFKVPPDPTDDAILKLQFLARLAIQYDVADLAAMVTVPAMLSLFVLRDGYVTMATSGNLILPCDLLQLWLHFVLLVCIKPLSFFAARKILERRMARALLGKPTIHGKSALAEEFRRSERERRERKRRAAEQRAAAALLWQDHKRGTFRKLGHASIFLAKRLATGANARVLSAKPQAIPIQLDSSSSSMGRPPLRQMQLYSGTTVLTQREEWAGTAAARSAEDGGMRRSSVELTVEHGQRLDELVLASVGAQLGFGAQRQVVLAKEFTVANLNYRSLFSKIILRSHRFFAACVLLGLFAVLPRHMLLPAAGANSTVSAGTRTSPPTLVPPWLVWIRVPPGTELAFDEAMRGAYEHELEQEPSPERLACVSAAIVP